ncbi:MAG: acetyl-CoA carboxylase carboxyltransferase subunit beta [Alphaproteobacteria bacterium]|nr:acetyl-CoA carboxylase carboxyltransferase subunit beta [Alphaproteobacteria bacterium]
MSWLTEVVTPKIKSFLGSNSNVEENLWTKCPSCERMLYSKELEDNLMVCGYCSHHLYLPAKVRFESIFDEKKYEEIAIVKTKDDPIRYRDTKRYTDRLKEARAKTGDFDAISIAKGKIGDRNAVVFVMNFAFMGGSLGISVGKSIIKSAQIASETNSALIGFTASGGARMQEGMLSLMQMPATIAAITQLKEAGLPYINVFTNPTTGGVLASFATLGDIHIAEPNALIGFAGARVIEKTIKQQLPEGFQRAEFLRKHGLLDMVVHRHNLPETLRLILDYTMRQDA